ncbi:sirohydrochlorin chelatase [Prochlorococcus sp. MIT 1223]|uniref:sirohydrochlorin chelatase n=1 Tax=Prochlorococcus sp. MIT 1223 TaxID=3096217 RepID=UPI002A7642C4|nr:sirohydrochlorin chelatase [Prochlorococcus sp. MIT 1223]
MKSALLQSNNSRIGVLICGHGSRHDSAIKEFAFLVSKIKLNLPGIPVEYGYLEFAKPVLTEALDKLLNQSVERVIAIPAMLFAAGHAKNDIPALLKKYSEKTGLKIDYGRELGINSLMIGAAGARIKEASDLNPGLAVDQTLLVVVGRGSSDPDANSNVSKITRMLVEGLGLGWGETVFSGVTFPLVEPGLRHLIRLGYKRIIVFPYFLFSGVLVNRILKYTKKVADDNPEIQFINASYLSSHNLVVETFIERLEEVLIGNNLMNCSLCKYRSDLLGFESEVGTVQESHHHHVEGLNSYCEICGTRSGCKCDKALDDHTEGAGLMPGHSHHPPYPNAEHPLGPVTLRY